MKEYRLIVSVALVVFLSMVLACLFGCTTSRDVSRETKSTEYISRVDTFYLSKTKVDSVYTYLRDSIFLFQKGDTLEKTVFKISEKYRYVYLTDTLFQTARDTVFVDVSRETKEVKKTGVRVIDDILISIIFFCAGGLVVYFKLRKK